MSEKLLFVWNELLKKGSFKKACHKTKKLDENTKPITGKRKIGRNDSWCLIRFT
jgi:hypothetical protein